MSHAEIMRAALDEILSLAEGYEDIIDTEDGRGRPNDWMQVAILARNALEGVVRP